MYFFYVNFLITPVEDGASQQPSVKMLPEARESKQKGAQFWNEIQVFLMIAVWINVCWRVCFQPVVLQQGGRTFEWDPFKVRTLGDFLENSGKPVPLALFSAYLHTHLQFLVTTEVSSLVMSRVPTMMHCAATGPKRPSNHGLKPLKLQAKLTFPPCTLILRCCFTLMESWLTVLEPGNSLLGLRFPFCLSSPDLFPP